MSEGIAEVFMAIVAYGSRHGVQRINLLPCCWEFEPAPGWFIAVNGHTTPRPLIDKDVMVQPMTAYVEWNGWPAGIITPTGGTLAAGSEANEASLLAALGWNEQERERMGSESNSVAEDR